MEAGQYQLQTFVSLVVILASAVVALLCDFLRRNNDQLRELTIALRAQLPEERERALAALGPRGMEANGRAAARASELTGRAGRQRPAGVRPPSDPVMAAEEAARILRRLRPEIAEGGPSPEAQDSEKRAAPAETKPPETKRTAVVVPIKPAAPALPLEPAATFLPGGLHDYATLEARMKQNSPISGAVIAVGYHEAGGDTGRHETSMNSAVRQLMTSLLHEGDFACSTGQREYLLLFPNEKGAAAQRRISQVAEGLWDFQLRSTGTFSVALSWGGFQAQREPLADAVASARERMHETQRNRKTSSAEALRLKAV